MKPSLSDREIDAIIFKLHDILSLSERSSVKELLKEAREGGLYEEELHKKLIHLQEKFKISEKGRHAVMDAIFG